MGMRNEQDKTSPHTAHFIKGLELAPGTHPALMPGAGEGDRRERGWAGEALRAEVSGGSGGKDMMRNPESRTAACLEQKVQRDPESLPKEACEWTGSTLLPPPASAFQADQDVASFPSFWGRLKLAETQAHKTKGTPGACYSWAGWGTKVPSACLSLLLLLLPP